MENTKEEVFTSGAKRSVRMPRYDLIPKVAQDRLAQRFTGRMPEPGADSFAEPGGALQYGEGNWQKGLPTSDVINHIMHHLTNYVDTFRQVLTQHINAGYVGSDLMEIVQKSMIYHSGQDDDLAAVMWGCCVLMHQEQTCMYHDDKFKYKEPSVPVNEDRQRIERNNAYHESLGLKGEIKYDRQR